MKSGQEKKPLAQIKLGDPYRLMCSNPSARILLMILLLLSLNLVACYDSLLAWVLKLLRRI